ncbi:putative N-acetyltransferase YafP [compost metagenome]
MQLDAWAPNEEKHLRQKAWNGSLSSNFTLVAEQDEFIVGFTDMTPQGHIERLFVHKNFQGQGVASALVVALETEARKLHLTEMSTEASITAKPFFKHMGLKVKESQNVERKGVLLTNFKMWKDL